MNTSESNPPKNKCCFWLSIVCLLLIFLLLFDRCSEKTPIVVSCKSTNLADAIKNSQTGDTILMEDNCNENESMKVTQDNIIIDGFLNIMVITNKWLEEHIIIFFR